MAEAGWFVCDKNYVDLVQCYFCDKQLDGWEPDDDPWEEHRKHSSKCAFVILSKKEADITVKEHFDLCFEVSKKNLIAKHKALKENLIKEKTKFMKENFPSERKRR